MKYEKSPIKPLSDLKPHSKYIPEEVPTKGNNVRDVGVYDNPNAPIGGQKRVPAKGDG